MRARAVSGPRPERPFSSPSSSPAGPAGAAEPAGVTLTGGCTIGLTSLDDSGGVIDSAIGPGTASQSNPLDVTFSGEVAWEGTAPLMSSGTYEVRLNGVPVPGFGGSFDNKEGLTSANGTADVGSILGVVSFLEKLVTIMWNVSGSVAGGGEACSGEVWVRTGSADPLFSGGTIAGLALGALGVVGLLKSLKGRHALRGLASGLILGIALALLRPDVRRLRGRTALPVGRPGRGPDPRASSSA